jgi:hypothetical protein
MLVTYVMILHNTLPVDISFDPVLDCTDSGFIATRAVLSTLILVFLFLQILGMGIFIIDLNPLSTSPLASFDSFYGFRNDILKMLLPAYFVFFSDVGLIIISSHSTISFISG